MAGDDTTRANTLLSSSTDGKVQQAVDHILLKQVIASLVEIKSDLKDYSKKSGESAAKLDEHIKACDRRYVELQRTNNSQNHHIQENANVISWVLHQLKGKAFDYAVVVFVMACYFLYQHHFHLPLPTP